MIVLWIIGELLIVPIAKFSFELEIFKRVFRINLYNHELLQCDSPSKTTALFFDIAFKHVCNFRKS